MELRVETLCIAVKFWCGLSLAIIRHDSSLPLTTVISDQRRVGEVTQRPDAVRAA